ncbi:MAG: TonB-dependent receptor [Lautropia sp. SCN 69-89]|nr:MAG: TonB-dependent receptor [Lautropia sp. SCN 69-89]
MNKSPSRAPLAALPLAIAAGFASSSFPALAAGPAALHPVVVTATRIEQPLADVVADVSIVDRETIERSGASTLADVLSQLPGISLTRNGGPGSATSVHLRGGDNRFTALYVDGVRVDSQSTGGASWNAIPLAQIERIEVLRGPAAAVYGSDALAGVVQVFTRRGEGAAAPFVNLGLGSLGTRKLDAGIGGAGAGFDWSVAVGRETSDGFNSQPAGNPDRDGYRSTSASASLGWQVSPAHRIEASALASRMHSQYDAFASTGDDRTRSAVRTLGLNWLAKWSDTWSTRIGMSQGSDRYEDLPWAYVTDTVVTGYLWHNAWKLGAGRLTADLERREDRLDNASTTPAITRRAQNALALGYGLRAGAHTLQLNARHDADSEFGGHTTAGAGYAYAFAPNWRATASTGTAFRAPTLFQRFSPYGTSSLRPEKGRSMELGARYAANGNAFGATVYRNRVTDLISWVPGTGPCLNGASTSWFPGCYGNTARADIAGVTLSGETRVGSVRLTASLDWMDPENAATGKVLQRRARRQATLGAATRVANWEVGVQTQLVGARFDDAANTVRLPGYGVLNLHASTRLHRDWTLLARVDNAGDKAYQTAWGYATAGRTLYLGLNWAAR